jgi:methionyl-tRNA formyltransferase
MGTPDLACASLAALLEAQQFEVVAVVTQPDRRKGRELKLTQSPVKQLANSKGNPVLQPERARDSDFLNSLRQFRPDLIAVAAYGQILPQTVLELPPLGCLNVHTSLLPKYRGAAPIQWAILNGDSETGVTIMKMDAGLDTGAILSQERTPILEQDDAPTLYDRLARIGARLLVETIPLYAEGKIQPVAQPADGVSYARKIVKEDGRIEWSRPARDVWNQIRGLLPWPGAFTRLREPYLGLLKIWRAEPAPFSAPPGEIISADVNGVLVGCGREAIRILELQREGARRLTPQQFLAGLPLEKGQRFANP